MIKEIIQRIGIPLPEKEKFPVDLKKLEKILEYTFQDKELILKALRHRSYLSLTHEDNIESNERLEFLGDAVLDLIVTEHLYKDFKGQSEGVLSKKKSILVSRQVLGHLTDKLGLGEYLLINKGEEKTGGRRRLSNLANLFEALLGAIYLDSGIKSAENFVYRNLLDQRDEFLKTKSYFNYKSSLLEFAQAKGWGFPKYEILAEEGPDHEKQFIIQVNVNDKWSATGTGRSKKNAEQRAAQNVLKKIEESSEKISKYLKDE
ncbi:MAG: ribonuclease III [Calditrichaceae bacterium]